MKEKNYKSVKNVLNNHQDCSECEFNDDCVEKSKTLVEETEDAHEEYERERKVVMHGVINFSFGKNGRGLSDELLEIGKFINTLSKDNHVYMTDSFIDECDDVYDLKFRVTPYKENAWMVKDDAFNND
jgi:hypothetical protein